MQLLAVPQMAEVPATASAASDSKGADSALFGQLFTLIKSEGGKTLPPAEVAAKLGMSVEQLQQALTKLQAKLAATQASGKGSSNFDDQLLQLDQGAVPAAASESPETFLLWLADQQQGLAGAADPALVESLQQWLTALGSEAKEASAKGKEQEQELAGDDAAQLLAALVNPGEPTPPAVAVAGVGGAPTGVGQGQGDELDALNAVATEAKGDGAKATVAGGASANPSAGAKQAAAGAASVATAAVTTDGGTEAASGEVVSSDKAGTIAAEQRVKSANSAQQPPAAADGRASQANSSSGMAPGVAVAATDPAGADDQLEAIKSDRGKTSTSASNLSDSQQRISAAVAGRAAAADERNGNQSGDNGSGKSSQGQQQPGPEVTSDRQLARDALRLSQWQVQWDSSTVASGDGVSGAATDSNQASGQGLSQLLGPTSALAASRISDAAASANNLTTLRHFGADPAAALGPQVQMLVARNLDQITVRLDPQDLGSMSIKVQVGADQQVNVQFHVTNTHTREMVEQALPRLREMLGDAGVQLGDTQVGQQQRDPRQMAGDALGRQSDGRQESGGNRGDAGSDSGASVEISDAVRIRSAVAESLGRLDFYV